MGVLGKQLTAIVTLVFGAAITAPGAAYAGLYTYTTLDAPGATLTSAWGIN